MSELQTGDAVLLPAPGQRAAMIRHLRDRNPRMPQDVIAKKVGCSEANVSQILKRYVKQITPEELADFQANQADIYDAVQHKALSSITDEHWSNSSALQLVTIAAISTDKARLVRGQATSINVTALVDIATMIRERRDRDR